VHTDFTFTTVVLLVIILNLISYHLLLFYMSILELVDWPASHPAMTIKLVIPLSTTSLMPQIFYATILLTIFWFWAFSFSCFTEESKQQKIKQKKASN